MGAACWAPCLLYIIRSDRVGLVISRQTFVRRRHLGWTASEPPPFSRNGTPPRDENRRCIRDRDESRRFLGRPRSAPWFAPYDLDGGGRIAVQIVAQPTLRPAASRIATSSEPWSPLVRLVSAVQNSAEECPAQQSPQPPAARMEAPPSPESPPEPVPARVAIAGPAP